MSGDDGIIDMGLSRQSNVCMAWFAMYDVVVVQVCRGSSQSPLASAIRVRQPVKRQYDMPTVQGYRVELQIDLLPRSNRPNPRGDVPRFEWLYPTTCRNPHVDKYGVAWTQQCK